VRRWLAAVCIFAETPAVTNIAFMSKYCTGAPHKASQHTDPMQLWASLTEHQTQQGQVNQTQVAALQLYVTRTW